MSEGMSKRDISYDILRSVVIINALILHFDTKFNLSLAAYPFKMVQSCFFTVGAFFFFTAGVMAYAVYVPRFKDNSTGMTIKLILKGLKIYAIYIFYLLIMKIALGIKIEGGVIDFLLRHGLFLKVLFTFGTLYICAPLFIYLVDKTRQSVYFLLILTILTYLVLETGLRGNDDYRMLLVDRQQFLYPILPSFIMFFLGMVFCIFEQNNGHTFFAFNSLRKNVFYVFVVVLILICAFNKLYLNHIFFENAVFVSFRESIVIVAAVLFTKSLLKYSIRIRGALENWSGLCFGVKSLAAYVTGNILIGLITAKFHLLGVKLFILFTIIWITYLVSYWSWRAGLASRTVVEGVK
jgi:hypothetical protein